MKKNLDFLRGFTKHNLIKSSYLKIGFINFVAYISNLSATTWLNEFINILIAAYLGLTILYQTFMLFLKTLTGRTRLKTIFIGLHPNQNLRTFISTPVPPQIICLNFVDQCLLLSSRKHYPF